MEVILSIQVLGILTLLIAHAVIIIRNRFAR
jgi:hypothetical protein